MKKIIFASFIFIVSAISLAAQTMNAKVTPQNFPENFKSDGCTNFPDGDYLDCCVQHDLAYFKGGSWKERWRADGQLRRCVAAKNGWWHKPLASVIWAGVRIGGAPFLPTSFRWGFGNQKPKKDSAASTPKVNLRQ